MKQVDSTNYYATLGCGWKRKVMKIVYHAENSNARTGTAEEAAVPVVDIMEN